jgi:hypothetical protein
MNTSSDKVPSVDYILRDQIKVDHLACAYGDRYRNMDLDQLHTLATALGNAVKKIFIESEDLRKAGFAATAEYMRICAQDNETEMAVLMPYLSARRQDLQAKNAQEWSKKVFEQS